MKYVFSEIKWPNDYLDFEKSYLLFNKMNSGRILNVGQFMQDLKP